MPVFQYEAVDQSGTSSHGTIIADNPRAARSDLRTRGLLPVLVEATDINKENAKQTSRYFFRLFAEKLSSTELSLFLFSVLEISFFMIYELINLLGCILLGMFFYLKVFSLQSEHISNDTLKEFLLNSDVSFSNTRYVTVRKYFF